MPQLTDQTAWEGGNGCLSFPSEEQGTYLCAPVESQGSAEVRVH